MRPRVKQRSKMHTIRDDLSRYGRHPLRFVFRFVRRRWIAHTTILIAVLAAVGCSITTQ